MEDQKTKILIIEDDFYIRDLYQRQLKKEGFEVELAEDNHTAEKILKDYQPDLIILDIMLPEKSGLEILKELKSGEKTKDAMVLLLTNVSHDESIKEGFKLGADGYLVKAAYTPSQVVEEIKNHLARAK